MQFLGYKKKKGSSLYFTDNIVNPTFFRNYQLRDWEIPDGLLEFKGRQPVFNLKFKLEGIMSIASGSELIAIDIDTDKKYSFYNQEIFNLIECLADGRVSYSEGLYTGTFILQKIGKIYGLKLASQDDLDLIDDELPEAV